jgi:hypothetical protein
MSKRVEPSFAAGTRQNGGIKLVNEDQRGNELGCNPLTSGSAKCRVQLQRENRNSDGTPLKSIPGQAR